MNNADPCVRSRIPVSQTIGRTVLVSLPSILLPVLINSPLTISFSTFLIASAIITADSVSEVYFSEIVVLIEDNLSDLFCFSIILYASTNSLPNSPLIFVGRFLISSSFSFNSHGYFAAFFAKDIIASITVL